MGWLWSSESVPADTSQEQFSAQPSQGKTAKQPQAPASSSRLSASSTQDQSDADEWKELREALAADISEPVKSKNVDKTPSSNPSVQSPPEVPVAQSIYPSTMSCRQAFDQAYYCQSLGGQFINVYRYGELRKCSEQWSDFWFCMRSRNMPDEQRAQSIRKRYIEKDAKYKMGPSSEDVWSVRKEPLQVAFSGTSNSAADEGTVP